MPQNMQKGRTIQDWDFNARHIQNDIVPGKFVSSKTALIAFGPPKYSMTAAGEVGPSIGENRVLSGFSDPTPIEQSKTLDQFGVFNEFQPVPVGLIQNVAMSQGRNISKVYEIGSELPYQVPGKVVPNFGFSKVLYHGPSLLKFALNYYMERAKFGLGIADVDPEKIKNMVGLDNYQVDFNGNNSPGKGNFFINLASELFQFPFGVLLYLKDNAGQPYGAFYIEDCYITTHSMNLDVGSTVIVENAGVDCSNFVPLEVDTGFGEQT